MWESPFLADLAVGFRLDRLVCSGQRGKKYFACTTLQLGPFVAAAPHLVYTPLGTPPRKDVAKLVAKLLGVGIYDAQPTKALGALVASKKGYGA